MVLISPQGRRSRTGALSATSLAVLVLLFVFVSACNAWTTPHHHPSHHWYLHSSSAARSSTGLFSEADETEATAMTATTAAKATPTPPQRLSLLDAAASITQESCPLLGVKSLGVDYGLVRTGLAVTVGYEPIPLAILQQPDLSQNWNASTVASQVLNYARSQQVHRIIVGLPLHKNGTVAAQTNLTLAFGYCLTVASLQTLGPAVPVHFFDERYTSKEAAARARSKNPQQYNNNNNGALYGTLDADAACIILENYYQDNGVGAHALELPEPVREECLRMFERQQEEQDRLRRQVQEDREAKVQRRKEAIARALKEERANDAANGGEGSSKKKKKKKRKK